MSTQPGIFRAPQFGLPHRPVEIVREIPKKQFTKDHLSELAKLMYELGRRDLTGVVRR